MNYPCIYSHLLSRGFDPSKYHVIIDELNLSSTFLLWNRLGQLVGFQRYTPRYPKKGDKPTHLCYFTWASKPHHTIWGWEYVKPDTSTLYLTEGIFDAIKLRNEGLDAIALLGNAGSPAVRSYLRWTGYRLVAVCDNDAAGKTLAKSAHLWYNVPNEFKDLGEMTQLEVQKWLQSIKQPV